jgi:signal transduction histidine kinase
VTVRRRLASSSVLIALAAVLVLGVPLGVVESARVRSDENGRLEREADAVAGVIDDRIERRQPVTSALIAPLVHRGHRVTVVVGGRTASAGAALPGARVAARSGTAHPARVTAYAPRSEIAAREHRSWLLIAVLGLGGVVTAFGLAAAQARRLSRPLEAVAATSARLGEGDFSVRTPRSGVPEIDAIAEALDRSARRIALLVGREREFSSNVSHQLRTPMTALRLRLEESVEDPEPGTLAAALREADRLEATVAALLAHARAEEGQARGPVDLRVVAAEHVAAWRPVLRQTGRSITLAGEGSVVAVASPGTVGQVLDVLLENALQHGAGPIAVEVGWRDGWGTIGVQDAGNGVPESQREAIFARGTTGAGGTGIGLHLARALAAADGGALRLTVTAPARFELALRRVRG